MPTKEFCDLAKPLHDDPRHAADIQRLRKEAIVEVVEYGLAELRRGLDVTQTELAETLGSLSPLSLTLRTPTSYNFRPYGVTSRHLVER